MTGSRMWQYALLSLCLLTFASANKLDIGGKAINSNFHGVVEYDKTFYSGSSSIIETHSTRSLLDCIDSCLAKTDSRSCLGSLYTAHPSKKTEPGRCMLLDYTHDDQQSSDLVGKEISGKFTSFSYLDGANAITDGDNSLCNSVTCATGAKCYVISDLDDPNVLYPYCIGNNEDCDLYEEYTNIQHFFGNRYDDETNDGVFQTVTYTKTRADSYLRVNFNTALRGHYQATAQCQRFYVTFNGSECSDPNAIDFATYSAQTGDMRRATNIDGTCKNLPAGQVTVDLRIGYCSGYSSTNGQVGWKNTRQLLIMEIVPRDGQITSTCPGLSVFNYHYYSYSSASGQQHGNGHNVFTSDTYRKAGDASDTNLRIKWQGNLRCEQISNVNYCCRWVITIDNVECSPTGDIVMHPTTSGTYSYQKNILMGRTIEAICENIAAGDHVIRIKTTACYYTQTEPAYFYTGWKTPMRMHIEEVRQSARLDAVVTNDRRILRNPFQNMHHNHRTNMNNGDDNDVIFDFTYTKNNEYTSLRLTATGDHRIIPYGHSGWGHCSRWYFKIDDYECTDPGPIEGISYFNYETNWHHPMQVSGVCYGHSAKNLKIAYWVGHCHGESSLTEAYTGWGSSFHVFVEEVNLEEQKDCVDGAPMVC